MLLSLIITISFIAFLVLFLINFLGRNGTLVIILTSNLIFVLIVIWNIVVHSSLLLSVLKLVSFSEGFSFFYFEWSFLLDQVSLLFLFIILFITTSVILFAGSYMYTDPRFSIFIVLLQFFMFFMIVLIISDNLVQIFIGWEGVGIISFLLINFWFLRQEANKGALKALIFNRIGDFGYVGMFIYLMVVVKTTSLSLLSISLVTSDSFFFSLPNFISFFLLLAVFGKSAQLLLYAWLPDAMEGPTPVSSLLHSATMVTAGVYLLIRTFDILLAGYNLWWYIAIFISGITSIFCGLYAFTKFDIKKIIAFSTCSQLGLMICSICFGFVSTAFFHLFIHAFFKALLFIASGIIIHSLADDQDIRMYGRSSFHIPVFYMSLLLGSVNIMGIFFFSGYYSKEFLLLSVSSSNLSILFKSFLFLSSLFTILYSIRLFLYNTTNHSLSSRYSVNTIQSLDPFLLGAILFLSIPSIFAGFYVSDSIIGLGNYYSLFSNLPVNHLLVEIAPYSLSLLFIFIALISFIITYILRNWLKKSLTYVYSILLVFHIIIQEFYIQKIYWIMNRLFNVIAFNYVVKITERTISDSFSFFGLLSLSFYMIKKEKFYIKGNLISLFFVVIFFTFSLICLLSLFHLLNGLDCVSLKFAFCLFLLQLVPFKHSHTTFFMISRSFWSFIARKFFLLINRIHQFYAKKSQN